MKNKGVSTVIATVMIILLTVIAGGIIAGIIIPFVKDNLNDSTKCLPYNDYFLFEDSFGYNCFQDENVFLSIRAKNDKDIFGEIKNVQIVVLNDSGSSVFVVPSEQVKLVDGRDSLIPNPAGVYTYSVPYSQNIKKIEIYTVLNSGKTCGPTDIIEELKIC